MSLKKKKNSFIYTPSHVWLTKANHKVYEKINETLSGYCEELFYIIFICNIFLAFYVKEILYISVILNIISIRIFIFAFVIFFLYFAYPKVTFSTSTNPILQKTKSIDKKFQKRKNLKLLCVKLCMIDNKVISIFINSLSKVMLNL